jgi:transposase-like protein
MRPLCPRCSKAHPFKNGFFAGRQKWRCRGCSYDFSLSHLWAVSYEVKKQAAELYEAGQPCHVVAKKLGVSPTSVMKWARCFCLSSSRVHTQSPRLVFPRAVSRALKQLRVEIQNGFIDFEYEEGLSPC